ncbi:MAG: glycosyltransferase family 1 protein [Deltaproteobacteria bacterium]|nr:glycosyltransferase family 1 protein [Deltaproteobacteria bacterium]
MKIVIDGRCIPNQLDGTGRVAINVIKALSVIDRDISLTALIRSDLSDKIRSRFPQNISIVNVPYRHIHPYTVLKLGNVVDSLGADLFFSPHMLQPMFMKTPSVITLNDTMWFGDTSTQAQGRPLRMFAGKVYFRSLVEISVRKASRIIVPSESTYNDIYRFWPNRIQDCNTILYGTDPMFEPANPEVSINERINELGLNSTRFFLHVTNGKPYKNTPRVIEAFIKATGGSDRCLAIVGRKSVFTPDIQALVAGSNAEKRIKFLGSVDDEDLVSLFQTARALIFPSLFEGFGLPVIEAMACGCPVITSTRGSLGQVAGNAALIVNPESVDEISDAILILENDEPLRQSLIKKGSERAQQFSWEKAALEMLKVFEQVL